MSVGITYRSYAKINLYLDVLDKRADGYHNIETIFQSVGLFDELTFSEEPSRVSLVCSTPELGTFEENLVYRAAMLLKERTGCSEGARIQLTKHIPIAAGLAGGSGNAAATLVALNTLWNLKLRPDQILEFALELGSDIPYCIVGGTIAATSRGEKMESLPPIGKSWFLLLHPPVAVSASRVYNSPYLGHSPESAVNGKTPSFQRALALVVEGKLPEVIFNRMERPVFVTHPDLQEAKKWLLDEGCPAAAMSGSGPTIFGLCESRKQAMRLAEEFNEYRTSVVSSVPFSLERVQ